MRYTLHALLMVVFFTLAVIAENKVKNTIIDNVLQISKCEVPPSIDGDLDGVWHYVTATPLLKFEDGVGVHNDFADHFTNFRVMWDDDYFYVFVQVVDDTILTTQGADPWMKDCIELFFDGNNAKLYQQYDANDVQWRYVAMENWQSPTKTGNGKGEYAWKRTVNGYNLELRIPKDSLTFPLQADHVLGFEISNADRDNDIQARTHVLHWWATDGNTWRYSHLFGTAILTDKRTAGDLMLIPKAEGSPTIDGTMDPGEWDVANELSLLHYEGPPEPNPVTFFDNWNDHRTSFWTMWDENYFYVFVQVVDDTILTTQGADPWMKDCIELFFDGDNAKLYQQYDANDVQWRYVAMENWQSPTKTGNGKGEYAWKRTVNGYNLELRIPKDSLTFPLQADHVLGFEISNADRDNDIQARTHVLHWWAIDGNTWRWANLFGTAKLVGGPTAVEQGTLANEFRLEQNYPNPFNPETRIVYSLPERAHVRLSVYNILGQEVALLVNNVLEQGTYTAHFNAKGYPSGVYIYKLQTQGTSIVRKMLLIK